MARKDMTLAAQLAASQAWKDPLVDAVVATFCYRHLGGGNVLDAYEWLVTERVRGADVGQLQAHHGGFLQVTDRDIHDGAAREVLEETGYVLDPDTDLAYITSIGPAIYRSTAAILGSGYCMLTISEQEAEPDVAFVLPLFAANLTRKTPSHQTDGEVKDMCWMTARAIIDQFGKTEEGRPYSRFTTSKCSRWRCCISRTPGTHYAARSVCPASTCSRCMGSPAIILHTCPPALPSAGGPFVC